MEMYALVWMGNGLRIVYAFLPLRIHDKMTIIMD